jgi:hypothetical protein
MTIFKGHGGKARPANCACNPGFVCGACLARAKPWHFTPGGPTKPCHPGFYDWDRKDESA